MSKPFTIFSKSIERAKNLLELWNEEVDLVEKDDLVRAAVIISVAAFDRYFTAKFCDVLVAHLKSGAKIGPELFDLLEKAGFDTEFALTLISDAVEKRTSRPFRKIRTIVQNSLSNQTTHRDDAIDKLFLPLGLRGLCAHAARKAKMPKLTKHIMDLVDLRNAIAHEAHVKQNGEPRSVDGNQIATRIKELASFVQRCDEIVDAKFGKKSAVSA